MPSVDLTEQEWGQLMGILSGAPWRDANPLLMKIGEQLRTAHNKGQVALHPSEPPPGATVVQMGKGAHNE